MITIRNEIIEKLKEDQTATAIGLAKNLSVTIANIRYHLKILMQKGVVEIIDEVNLEYRGRPTLIFALSRKEKSTGINTLLRSNLEELTSIRNPRMSLDANRTAHILFEADWDQDGQSADSGHQPGVYEA